MWFFTLQPDLVRLFNFSTIIYCFHWTCHWLYLWDNGQIRTMIWIKRMLLGGFIVNIIYIAIMLLQPDLSILVNTLISGTITGLIMLFLITKEHIQEFYQLDYLISPTFVGFFVYRHLGLLGCNIAIVCKFVIVLTKRR